MLSTTEREKTPGVVATLRDGARVRMRPVRRSDGPLLRRGFERLSEESRYRRFRAPTFVRDQTRPEVAETAVTVVDDWHGRGVGTLLLELLAVGAREEGIARFTGLMLASNREMMELLESLGPLRVVDREAATVEVEAPLPEDGLPPALRDLLRLSAQGHAAIAPSPPRD